MQDNANDVLGIDPDVRQLVYTQAVANGGQGSYDIMKNLYLGVSGFVIEHPCPSPSLYPPPPPIPFGPCTDTLCTGHLSNQHF